MSSDFPIASVHPGRMSACRPTARRAWTCLAVAALTIVIFSAGSTTASAGSFDVAVTYNVPINPQTNRPYSIAAFVMPISATSVQPVPGQGNPGPVTTNGYYDGIIPKSDKGPNAGQSQFGAPADNITPGKPNNGTRTDQVNLTFFPVRDPINVGISSTKLYFGVGLEGNFLKQASVGSGLWIISGAPDVETKPVGQFTFKDGFDFVYTNTADVSVQLSGLGFLSSNSAIPFVDLDNISAISGMTINPIDVTLGTTPVNPDLSTYSVGPGQSIDFTFNGNSLPPGTLVQMTETFSDGEVYNVVTAYSSVPEPSVIILLSAGLVGVLAQAHRSRRRLRAAGASRGDEDA
jgi:hypothetical protein